MLSFWGESSGDSFYPNDHDVWLEMVKKSGRLHIYMYLLVL